MREKEDNRRAGAKRSPKLEKIKGQVRVLLTETPEELVILAVVEGLDVPRQLWEIMQHLQNITTTDHLSHTHTHTHHNSS